MLFALLVSQALAVPLIVERFDTLPEGWKERVAAEAKGAAKSKYAVAGGVMTFTAEAKTGKFLSLGKRIELRGVQWLKLDAKITLSVSGADPAAVCGAFVRFDTGEVVPMRPCLNRTDAEAHTRYIPVPAAARDAEIGVMLGAPGTLSVDELVVDKVAPDMKSLVRGRFVYHWLGSDSFSESALEANDTKLAELASFFGTPATVKLDYWKYPDAASLEAYSGQAGPYRATATAVHTGLRNDTRALTAALAQAWGNPGPLLFEGLAVHLAGEWEGRDPRLSTRQQVGAGSASSLAALLDPAKFAAEPPEKSFVQAGAFVAWIVQTKGAETLKQCFTAVQAGATPAANQAALEGVLGAPLARLEADFRASL